MVLAKSRSPMVQRIFGACLSDNAPVHSSPSHRALGLWPGLAQSTMAADATHLYGLMQSPPDTTCPAEPDGIHCLDFNIMRDGTNRVTCKCVSCATQWVESGLPPGSNLWRVIPGPPPGLPPNHSDPSPDAAIPSGGVEEVAIVDPVSVCCDYRLCLGFRW